MVHAQTLCLAFEGHELIAAGPLAAVVLVVKQVITRGETAPVLIFEDANSQPVELDLRGSADDIVARLAAAPVTDEATTEAAPRGPGRPKLGVVAREITLLPRHWDWLSTQTGGASVALRKLVETASRAGEKRDQKRQAQEICYRFLSAIAGNLAGFEEATRTLFADDAAGFDAAVTPWPEAVRDHAQTLAARVFTLAA